MLILIITIKINPKTIIAINKLLQIIKKIQCKKLTMINKIYKILNKKIKMNRKNKFLMLIQKMNINSILIKEVVIIFLNKN